MTEIGSTLGGRYRLVELLGQGGMATDLPRARRQLERDVAVKLLRPEFGQDPDFLARFRDEARAAASLGHPNVVAVHDSARTAGPYIVMELVEGEDLASIIRGPGRCRRARPPASPPTSPGRCRPPTPRDRPPRRQARQHPHRARRPGARRRLRHRPGDGRGAGDAAGHDHGLGPLLQPRAGARRAGDGRVGHLLARHRPVRDADRPAAVLGRRRRRGRDGPADSAAAAAVPLRSGPARARRDRARPWRSSPRARSASAARWPTRSRRPRRAAGGRPRPRPSRGGRRGRAAARRRPRPAPDPVRRRRLRRRGPAAPPPPPPLPRRRGADDGSERPGPVGLDRRHLGLASWSPSGSCVPPADRRRPTPPPERVVVPTSSACGRPRQAARRGHGLVLATTAASGDQPVGTIIAQDPPAARRSGTAATINDGRDRRRARRGARPPGPDRVRGAHRRSPAGLTPGTRTEAFDPRPGRLGREPDAASGRTSPGTRSTTSSRRAPSRRRARPPRRPRPRADPDAPRRPRRRPRSGTSATTAA